MLGNELKLVRSPKLLVVVGSVIDVTKTEDSVEIVIDADKSDKLGS